MRFYLGTHKPGWLGQVDVPLFLSHRQLRERASLPRARTEWALDSGGYTELSEGGRWGTSAEEYAEAVERYAGWAGRLAWAAPQDWICVPSVLAETGLSVEEHLHRTVASVIELRGLVRSTPIVPMLQGWEPDDYFRCAELYAAAGIDLADEPVVGLGSIAARQGRPEVASLVRQLAGAGLRLHGLGVKIRGWEAFGDVLASADSMAWSYDARRRERLAGCTHRGTCSNCQRYALRWRDDLLRRPHRVPLFS